MTDSGKNRAPVQHFDLSWHHVVLGLNFRWGGLAGANEFIVTATGLTLGFGHGGRANASDLITAGASSFEQSRLDQAAGSASCWRDGLAGARFMGVNVNAWVWVIKVRRALLI